MICSFLIGTLNGPFYEWHFAYFTTNKSILPNISSGSIDILFIARTVLLSLSLHLEQDTAVLDQPKTLCCALSKEPAGEHELLYLVRTVIDAVQDIIAIKHNNTIKISK